MKLLRYTLMMLLPALLATPSISQEYGDTFQDSPSLRDGGHGHGGGGGHKGDHGGGGGGYGGGGHASSHGGGGGGGYGHPKPKPHKSCTPNIITKFKTVYKDRKAPVFNNVEIRNPKPDIRKVTESRYTTIRYPIFITQVLKPKLTQVETKVKPLFFTKTLQTYKTVFFTVTGIGQVTVTTIKYEKEYITRCQKKGYDHHRSVDDGAEIQPDVPQHAAIYRSQEPSSPLYRSQDSSSQRYRNQQPSSPLRDPPGVPYDYSQETYRNSTTGPPSNYRSGLRPITTGSFGRPRPRQERPSGRYGPQESRGLSHGRSFRTLGHYGSQGSSGLSPSITSHPNGASAPHPPLPIWPSIILG